VLEPRAGYVAGSRPEKPLRPRPKQKRIGQYPDRLPVPIMQGGVFSNNGPVLYQLSFASSAGWGCADMASAVRLNDRQQGWKVARQISTIDAQNPQKLFQVLSHPSRSNPRSNHHKGAWSRAVARARRGDRRRARGRDRRPPPLRSCVT
jgi:hypothetical protein